MAATVENRRVDLRPDVLIVGSGPSGLACATSLSGSGLNVVVVDQGTAMNIRVPDKAEDLAAGVGGAGLYSDGKFSFYPSATRLWSLEPRRLLLTAYDTTARVLQEIGIEAPALPTSLDGEADPAQSGLRTKRYPSFYAALESRRSLVDGMLKASDCRVILSTKAVRIVWRDGEHIIVDLRPVEAGSEFTITPRYLVLAMGRFGPLSAQFSGFGQLSVFRRLELGFRIEQPRDAFFLRDDPALDPKVIAKSANGPYSWRTFCCCRDGEILATRFDGWTTVSGRADCPPTGRSSVGFNLRLEDAVEASEIWQQITTSVPRLSGMVIESYASFMASHKGAAQERSSVDRLYGRIVGDRLREGLRLLVDRYGPGAFAEARLVGPGVEGVGFYPNVSPNLQLAPYPIWVPGDGAGAFRGIVAALVSGFFVGAQIRQASRSRTTNREGR